MTNTLPPGYLRPLSIASDLGELADLIQIAFGDELRRTGSNMVQDLRRMAGWGALMDILPGPWSLLRGYVWECNGRIVGNASFNREQDRGDWQLSNVAVLPEMRGRGIASRLVDASLRQIRANGGQRVYLQVRQGNSVAQGLYERRGFVTYDTVQELSLHPVNRPLAIAYPDNVQPVRWWHSRQIVSLARQALPPAKLAARPRTLHRYRYGLGQSLVHTLMSELCGRRCSYAVFEDRRAIAFGRIDTAGVAQAPEMELLVLPSHRGRLETPLAMALLERQKPERGSLRAYVSVDHPEAAEALQKLGFDLLRTLNEMILTL